MKELVKNVKKFKNIRVWGLEDGRNYRVKDIITDKKFAYPMFMLQEIDLSTNKFIRNGRNRYVTSEWMTNNL